MTSERRGEESREEKRHEQTTLHSNRRLKRQVITQREAGEHCHGDERPGSRWGELTVTYPAGAGALALGKQEGGTLQHSPGRCPVLPVRQNNNTVRYSALQ